MSRLPALLVTHGHVGDALLEAAERIVGKLEDVSVLSNDGLSRESLTAAVSERVRQFGPGGGLLFVDVAGDSRALADRLREKGQAAVVVLEPRIPPPPAGEPGA